MSSVRKESGQFFSTSLNPGPLEVIAAVFGLLCIFISGLLGFVMLMEYNPKAKYFKENGTSKSAEIVSFQKTEPDRMRLEVRIEKEQGLYTTNSDYAAKLSHLKNGDMITAAVKSFCTPSFYRSFYFLPFCSFNRCIRSFYFPKPEKVSC